MEGYFHLQVWPHIDTKPNVFDNRTFLNVPAVDISPEKYKNEKLDLEESGKMANRKKSARAIKLPEEESVSLTRSEISDEYLSIDLEL